MFGRAQKNASLVAAAVAPAAAACAILSVSFGYFGSGPGFVLGAVGALTVGPQLPAARGRAAILAAGAALLGVGGARWMLSGAWRVGGGSALWSAALLLAVFVAWGLGAPGAARLRGASGKLPSLLLVGAVVAGLGAFSTLVVAPVVFAAVAFVAVVLGGSAGGPVEQDGLERAPARAARAGGSVGLARVVSTALGAAVILGAAGVVALTRTPLDPTPLAAVALVGAGALAASLPVASWARVAGAVVLAGALYAAARGEGLAALASAGRGGLWLAGVGAVAGALLAASTPARWRGVPLLIAAFALPAGLDRAPVERARAATRPAATLLGDASRREALARVHEEWREAFVYAGAAGADAAWVRDGGLVLELDGVVFDPSSRQGSAERFAGLLAACATAGRDRARVTDDPAGLALGALRGAGFVTVDVATPDPGLVRALASSFPELGKAWLSPGVRLLPVPGAAVARLGAPADAVVETVRAPWTDARGALPDAAALADARRTLAPGGVHVVAFSTTALTPAHLSGWLRAFVRVYPAASLWLPPAGADTAVVLGSRDGAPLAWKQIEACASAPAASALGLAAPVDVAGLLLAGPEALRALPPGPRLGPGLPPPMPVAGPPPLTQLSFTEPDVAAVFDAEAPGEAIRERNATVRSFLELLRASTSGEMADAVSRARALASAPGGALALAPLIRPQLDRVRSSMARGRREGLASRAWEDAETALTSARILAPDYPETRCVEGELALARNQLSRADEAFGACAAGQPTNLDALDGLATVRRLQGDTVGLEVALRRARDARPDVWTTAHNLGYFLYSVRRYDEAERLLREGAAAQARSDSPSAVPHLALAHLYLDTSRPERALAEAVQATRLAPDSAEAAFLRGAARYDLGQYRLAEEEFRAALRIDPENVRARGGLGLVQARDGAYAAAAESFRAVLLVEPRNQAVAENLRQVEALIQGGEAP